VTLSMLAATPALPLHEAGKYVAGAYIVAFVLILLYVAIMAVRLSRIERELGELLALTEPQNAEETGSLVGESAEELDVRRPGSTSTVA
jgi:CcmD family protein